MQVTYGRENDHCRLLNAPGAYEWWYTDVLSPDGEWGIVAIFLRGMPMSPDYLVAQKSNCAPSDHCGYAVSIYHRGRKIHFAFRGINEPDLSNAATHIDLGTIGRFDHNCIEIDTRIDDLRRSVAIRIENLWENLQENLQERSQSEAPSQEPSQSEAPPQAPSQSPSQAAGPFRHGWNLTAPRLPVRVSVKLREDGIERAEATWEGVAYRDHNWGERAMQSDFHHWYWGRVHGADRTIVYLAAPSADDLGPWAGEVTSDGTITPWTEVVVTPSKHGLSILGLWAPRTVKITGVDAEGQMVTVITTHDDVIEDGPFYQRYLSRWNVNGADLGIGTSEYMNVARYKRAWIRPFLRLPWFQHG